MPEKSRRRLSASQLILVIAVIACCGIGWWWYRAVPTTVLVVRHAEKAPQTAADPHLSPAGVARATELARVAGDAGIEGIYATEFFRTQETVAPLAADLGLSVAQVGAADVEGLVERILDDHRGSVVLVAGHSNTVPTIVAGLGAGEMCPRFFPLDASGACVIPDHQYDNLIIVTIPGWGRRHAIRLRYGVPTP